MNSYSSARKELKYYINNIDYLILKNKLSEFFSRDKNSNSKGFYTVRSLYFDNKSNDNYYEKIDGIENRKKYRIRIYNMQPEPVKFEIKSKKGSSIFKESALISSSDINRLVTGDYSCLLNYSSKTSTTIYCDFLKDFYRPVVLIDYMRDAYLSDINNLRVTFDSDIRKDEINLNNLFAYNTKMTPIINGNKVIMEIKYSGELPTWIKKLLRFESFERCAISKYTLSRYIQN